MSATQLLVQLIAIPSQNPMGRDAPAAEFGESRLAEFVEGVCRSWGFATAVQVVERGRPNVIAWIEGTGRSSEATLLWDAHLDTVSAEGMTVAPFAAARSGNRILGRGACDVKGGMAAMMTAAARLADQPRATRPSLILSFTVNEEHGFSGVRALPLLLRELPLAFPGAAIVLEPTELDLVVVHKGVVRWPCHAIGRAAHSSRPEEGVNAIYRMADALPVIARHAGEVLAERMGDSRCGPATLSVGTIQGGTSVNVVPDHCTIEIDRRLVQGESPDGARSELIAFLAHHGFADLVHDPPTMQAPPLGESDSALTSILSRQANAIGDAGRRIGAPYATNAAFLASAGIPAVVFGPGAIAQAHTADEYIEIEQLDLAAEILYRTAIEFASRAS